METLVPISGCDEHLDGPGHLKSTTSLPPSRYHRYHSANNGISLSNTSFTQQQTIFAPHNIFSLQERLSKQHG
jgi:hypothetical protein